MMDCLYAKCKFAFWNRLLLLARLFRFFEYLCDICLNQYEHPTGTPCITDCVLAELEKLGQKYRVALRYVVIFNSVFFGLHWALEILSLLLQQYEQEILRLTFECLTGCYFQLMYIIYMRQCEIVSCYLLTLLLTVDFEWGVVGRVAKDPRFETLPCTHKGTYADDCIVDRVTRVSLLFSLISDILWFNYNLLVLMRLV